MADTVITLCLAPASQRRLAANHLRGDLFRENYVRKDVLYTTVPDPDNAAEACEKLDAALHAITGKRIVEGHSMGWEVGQKWLREEGPDSTIDPDDILFVGSGSPERKYGGVTTVPDSGLPAIYGGTGIPDDTPYTVYDIARQYDFFADYPTGTMNDDAQRNSLAGALVHLDYGQVAVNDPKNVTWVEGSVHYVLAPTYPLPMISGLRAWSDRVQMDADQRASVDSAYTRPFPVPTPAVRRVTSWLGWNTSTNRFITANVPRWKPFG